MRCSKCILPETYPSIHYDEAGVCNYCRNYIPEKYEKLEEFEKLLISLRNEDKKYNCLIGLSGGRDSSYLAFKAIKEFGLRPLAYSFDNGHMPESAKKNIRNISEILGIKTIIIEKDVAKNDESFKRMFLAWAKKPSLGMIQSFCIGCRGGINKYIPEIIKKYDIKYLIDGGNYLEKTSYKLGFLGVDRDDSSLYGSANEESDFPKYLLMAKLFNEIVRNPYYLSFHLLKNGFLDYIQGFGKYSEFIKIRPFMYERYDEEKVISIIKNELNWETPSYFPLNWRSDCTIAMLKNYCYQKMVGFSDYDCALSNMIREGSIDRGTAAERIELYKQILNNNLAERILKMKGIDPYVLQQAIQSWKETHNPFLISE